LLVMDMNNLGVDVNNVIVLLVDDTEAAQRAGAWALRAARRQQTGLLCVHVAHYSAFARVAMASGAPTRPTLGATS
jgi:hypothetical protein